MYQWDKCLAAWGCMKRVPQLLSVVFPSKGFHTLPWGHILHTLYAWSIYCTQLSSRRFDQIHVFLCLFMYVPSARRRPHVAAWVTWKFGWSKAAHPIHLVVPCDHASFLQHIMPIRVWLHHTLRNCWSHKVYLMGRVVISFGFWFLVECELDIGALHTPVGYCILPMLSFTASGSSPGFPQKKEGLVPCTRSKKPREYARPKRQTQLSKIYFDEILNLTADFSSSWVVNLRKPDCRFSPRRVHPFRTAVPFGGQTTQSPKCFPPQKNGTACSPERVKLTQWRLPRRRSRYNGWSLGG